MRRKTQLALASLPVISVIGLSKPEKARAETISFGVSPSITQVMTQPGETTESTITIQNSGKTSVTLSPTFQAFIASPNEDGQVYYRQDASAFLRYITVLEGENVISEITIPPNSKKELTVRIAVPESEKAVDYYFSLILFNKPITGTIEAIEKQVTANTNITAGVASHFLVSIHPETAQSISLIEFSSPLFSQSSVGPFVVRATNASEHFSQVHGQITISNLVGKTVDSVIIPETVILARSTRSLLPQAQIKQSDTSKSNISTSKQNNYIKEQHEDANTVFPGVYKATVALTGPNITQPITQSAYIIIAPVELLVSLIAVLFLFFFIKKRLKKKFL